MTLFFRCILISVLVFEPLFFLAQNLLPNGSFEEYIDCPTTLDGIESNCEDWFQARGTCDYYNSCSPTGFLSVPHNIIGWQKAVTGNAYAGIIAYSTSTPDWREHIGVELTQAMEVNQEYYFSFYASSGYDDIWRLLASNGLGVRFTQVFHSSLWDNNPIDNPSPVSEDVQFLNYDVINDTTNWVQIKGSFIADSTYSYMVIGSFLNSDLISYESIVDSPFGEAYYFIDEVRLSTDSVFAWYDFTTSIQTHENVGLKVFPNPTTNYFYFEENSDFKRVDIFSIDGKIVGSHILLDNWFIDVSKLEKGKYILTVTNRNEEKSHVKVVIN